jgi:hypothetical protein
MSMQSPPSKSVNAQARWVGSQNCRYQVSPMESPVRYEQSILGVPLSPGDSWSGSSFHIKGTLAIPIHQVLT